MPCVNGATRRCTINVERKVKITWVTLLTLTMTVGVVGLVFFSLPHAQAVGYLELVAMDGLADQLTTDVFSTLSQPVRITGALLLAVGLGLLLMPVRTRGWIERVVQWMNKKQTDR